MTVKKLLVIFLVLAGLIGAGVLGGLIYPFWEDSTLEVTLKNGEALEFPLSNEKGGSRRFFAYLKSNLPKAATVER